MKLSNIGHIKNYFREAKNAINEGGMRLLIKRSIRFLILRINMVMAVVLRAFIITNVKR